MLTRFGFGKPTGVPLQGETAGLLRPVSQWSARSKPTVTIGQEVAVSAMQIMAAATAIANGGVLLKPLLVKKIVSPQGTVVKEFGREPLWEVISVESARAMLSWMESATLPAGTAHRAAVDGVRISAKTGTAQVADARTGAYSASDFIASMIGIFPTDDPRLIIYVDGAESPGPELLRLADRRADLPRRGDEPHGQAGHSARRDRARRRRILRRRRRIRAAAGGFCAAEGGFASPRADAGVDIGSAMPDLRGTPKKLLLPLLLRQDLAVTINGSGYVVPRILRPARGSRTA